MNLQLHVWRYNVIFIHTHYHTYNTNHKLNYITIAIVYTDILPRARLQGAVLHREPAWDGRGGGIHSQGL